MSYHPARRLSCLSTEQLLHVLHGLFIAATEERSDPDFVAQLAERGQRVVTELAERLGHRQDRRGTRRPQFTRRCRT